MKIDAKDRPEATAAMAAVLLVLSKAFDDLATGGNPSGMLNSDSKMSVISSLTRAVLIGDDK